LLVTSADLKLIHEQLEGRGYLPPFDRSKHLRDTESNVKIEFLTSGGFPGDGKPKPISFPDPRNVFEERDGIKYVNLPTLIELKLASGMTSAHRGRDLADVQDVIQVLKLSEGFAESLDPYVREKYRQLWLELAFGRRFKTIYRSKKIGEPMKSIDDLISLIGDDDPRLSEMKADGVLVDYASGIVDGGVFLIADDRKVADKYGMQPEEDFFEM